MGDKEKLSVDTYYGVPLKQIIYKAVDDEFVIKENNLFTIVSVGNIKNVDVTIPGDYEEITE